MTPHPEQEEATQAEPPPQQPAAQAAEIYQPDAATCGGYSLFCPPQPPYVP